MLTDTCEADTAAMKRLGDGDDVALNELMARWKQPVVNFLTRLCGNEATALDLAQETFLRVYEARERYDARGKFSAWLFTIARNLARNAHRWQQRHSTVSLDAPIGEDSDTLAAHLPDSNLTPDARALENERGVAVRSAVAELSEEMRSAVLLSEFEDLSHAEISVVLGCTLKAVETRLYHARRHLREKLTRWLK